jgi:predicted histone-like DNA-binding protein
MAVQIHRYLRRKVAADPTSPMVYHLKQTPGTSQTHTIKNLAKAIEEKSSLTAEDVIHATSALVRELKEVLLRGDRVKIDGFGIFSLTFNATEVETEKECTVKTINKVNIRFRADNALRLANESTSGTHGKNDVKFVVTTPAGGNKKAKKKPENKGKPSGTKPQNVLPATPNLSSWERGSWGSGRKRVRDSSENAFCEGTNKKDCSG